MAETYLICAIVGVVFIVVGFVVGLLGLDGDDAGGGTDVLDGGSEVPHDGGADFLRAFSIRSVAAWVAFFGLGGRGALEFGASEPVALVVAVLLGVAAIWAVYRLMRSLVAFNQSGSIVLGSEKGLEGTVYLRVPARRSGMGKVTIVQQGRTMEYDALTDDADGLAQGAPIVVVETLTPSQLLVARR